MIVLNVDYASHRSPAPLLTDSNRQKRPNHEKPHEEDAGPIRYICIWLFQLGLIIP